MNLYYLSLGSCAWFCEGWQYLTFRRYPAPVLLSLCWGCRFNAHLLTL